MPRPKRVSDAEVLDAAVAVLAERGMGAFTLSEIAAKVSLSRATLIQRFGDSAAILRLIAEHEVAATRRYLDGLPVETGPRGPWRFVEENVRSMGPGDGFAVRVAIAAMEAREPGLRILASIAMRSCRRPWRRASRTTPTSRPTCSTGLAGRSAASSLSSFLPSTRHE